MKTSNFCSKRSGLLKAEALGVFIFILRHDVHSNDVFTIVILTSFGFTMIGMLNSSSLGAVARSSGSRCVVGEKEAEEEKYKVHDKTFLCDQVRIESGTKVRSPLLPKKDSSADFNTGRFGHNMPIVPQPCCG